MHLKFVTPERVLFEEEVVALVAPTDMGQITVLPKHISLIANLEPGEMIVRTEEGDRPLVVSGGIIEVAQNRVIVLADTAEHVHELDFERAQQAAELADKLLSEKEYEIHEYDTLQHNLEKHKARISAFNKWRR